MQYVSEDPIHVVVRNETPALHDTSGRMVAPAQRRVFAKFKRGTAPEFAREIGLKLFKFKKMPEGAFGPESWLAFYDSVEDADQMGWTKEERQAIEEKLARVDGVVAVEKPKLAPPWPAYDRLVASKGGLTSKQVVERIVAKVVEDGYSASEVAAYELENGRRKAIVDALAELAGNEPDQPAAVEQEQEELIEA